MSTEEHLSVAHRQHSEGIMLKTCYLGHHQTILCGGCDLWISPCVVGQHLAGHYWEKSHKNKKSELCFAPPTCKETAPPPEPDRDYSGNLRAYNGTNYWYAQEDTDYCSHVRVGKHTMFHCLYCQKLVPTHDLARHHQGCRNSKEASNQYFNEIKRSMSSAWQEYLEELKSEGKNTLYCMDLDDC
jgi:hypothetical protein